MSESSQTLLARPLIVATDALITKFKRRQCVGSFVTARHTAELLRLIVSASKWNNAQTLMDIIHETGKRLIAAQPKEVSIGNVVRRVLNIIREEHLTKLREKQSEDDRNVDKHEHDLHGEPHKGLEDTPGLRNLLRSEGVIPVDYTLPLNFKSDVIEQINDFIEELANLYRDIAEQSVQHIHANEVILTYGSSRTVLEFLKAAARKRRFEVFVAETAPKFVGQETARLISEAKIPTTLITDSAVFALMARVNKVIIGAHAVVANGGLVAFSGGHALALAARYHSVPVIACTGLYKLSPLHPHDQDTFNELGAPSDILKFEGADYFDNVTVANPVYDYIPPDLVDFYITNAGCHSPSYVYRLLAEYYHQDDYVL